MLDADGKRMTDVYLKRRISEYYPEIDEIYNRSSEYVLFIKCSFYRKHIMLDAGFVSHEEFHKYAEKIGNKILLEAATVVSEMHGSEQSGRMQ